MSTTDEHKRDLDVSADLWSWGAAAFENLEPGEAFGPLMNLALAARDRPSIATSVCRTDVIGGAFGSPGGNIKPHAEYNFGLS